MSHYIRNRVVCDNRLRQNALAAVECIPYFNKQQDKLKYSKTVHETDFILGANAYMFRHQGAILMEFIRNRSVSPTVTSGASRLRFYHKN
jgi:hypothetical protein